MIETESRGPARWIFIANPKVVNAVGTADLERLREEIVSAAADDAIALIVLAGRAGNFCSGDNLKEKLGHAEIVTEDDIIREVRDPAPTR